jgi:hypothetical protein
LEEEKKEENLEEEFEIQDYRLFQINIGFFEGTECVF